MLIPVSLAAPAVRLELTVGDLGNLRRSHRRGYGAPGWTRTNVVGLEGRLPVLPARADLERANGVEPSRASLATMPRTMRARVIGSCRRICTCYLRLIRSVLISMSFAAEVVRTAGLAPAASEFQARLSAADLRPEVDTPTGVAPASSRFAGDRLELLGHGVRLG